MRASIFWLVIVAAGTMAAARAGEPLDFGAAINQAGAQRMLSQRIVKAYVQIGLEADAAASRTLLEQSVQRFESQLAYLRRLAPSVQAAAQAAELESAWRPFRKLALEPVSRGNARKLHLLGEQVLERAETLVQRLQEQSGTWESRLVNISGRQRMLSQRLAKLHLLRLYGIDAPRLREQAMSAQNELQGALAVMLEAPENTAEITRELRAVSLQWEWFRSSLGLEAAPSYPLLVADASEKILEQMERITALYAQRVDLGQKRPPRAQ